MDNETGKHKKYDDGFLAEPERNRQQVGVRLQFRTQDMKRHDIDCREAAQAFKLVEAVRALDL